MKKVVPWGFSGAVVSLLFFRFGVPCLPEGWDSFFEKLSSAFTYFGWAVGGFVVGAASGALVISFAWAFKTTRGNWTRVGR
ncbi:MAG: hypothetical protein HOI70_00870 [Opitutae bacterium]|nr:hypothetical protein [Opitutae bacterium]